MSVLTFTPNHIPQTNEDVKIIAMLDLVMSTLIMCFISYEKWAHN